MAVRRGPGLLLIEARDAMNGPHTDDLTCRELVELVTEYLEGALPAAERARFEAHLDGCSRCRVYLDQLRKTLAAAGRLEERSLPADVRWTLLQVFRRWKSGRPGTE